MGSFYREGFALPNDKIFAFGNEAPSQQGNNVGRRLNEYDTQ